MMTAMRLSKDQSALVVLRKRWKTSIEVFAREAFGIQPTDQQIEIMKAFQAPGAHVAVKAGHGVGKTATMAVCAIWHTLLFPDSKGAATAPSATQLKDVLMAECGKLINQGHPWVKAQLEVSSMRISVNGLEATQFLTGRTARPEAPDALQGLHAKNMAFFIDECFGVADSIFEVARGALSTSGARVLMCGNPTSTSGYGFEAFHRNKHLWKSFTLSCVDSPLVSPDYIKEMKTEYGEDSDVYKIRVLGEFPSTSVNQLISRDSAEAAAIRQCSKHQIDFAPVVLGVDVAWEGDDRSVIYLRQGLHSKCLGVYRNIDNMRLGGLVNQFWNEYKADAVFIDVGWGTGVIDYLRTIGRSPVPVNFGGVSLSIEYVNKRTEMWCEMKKWLVAGGAIYQNRELVEDLVGPEVYFQPSGKKMLEQKKMMKKRGLNSPDVGDALALTFAAPVQKQSEIDAIYEVRASNKNASDWDPFAS
jgi:hypothetical protein